MSIARDLSYFPSDPCTHNRECITIVYIPAGTLIYMTQGYRTLDTLLLLDVHTRTVRRTHMRARASGSGAGAGASRPAYLPGRYTRAIPVPYPPLPTVHTLEALLISLLPSQSEQTVITWG